MLMRIVLLSCFWILFASSAAQGVEVASETVETIPSRGEYTQTFILDRVENPLATIVLYSGNKGVSVQPLPIGLHLGLR